MRHLYYCEPTNEPYGEGNGWNVCAPAVATSWAVMQHDLSETTYENDVLVDAFDTWEAAHANVMASNREEIRIVAKDETSILIEGMTAIMEACRENLPVAGEKNEYRKGWQKAHEKFGIYSKGRLDDYKAAVATTGNALALEAAVSELVNNL